MPHTNADRTATPQRVETGARGRPAPAARLLGLAACGGSSSSSTATTTANAAATSSGGGATGPTGQRAGPLQGAARMPAEERDHAAQTDSRPAAARRCGRLPRRRTGGPQLPAGVTRAQYEAAVKKCGGGAFVGAGGSDQKPRRQTGAREVRRVHARKRRERAGTEHLRQRSDLQHQRPEHDKLPVPERHEQVQSRSGGHLQARRKHRRSAPRRSTQRKRPIDRQTTVPTGGDAGPARGRSPASGPEGMRRSGKARAPSAADAFVLTCAGGTPPGALRRVPHACLCS